MSRFDETLPFSDLTSLKSFFTKKKDFLLFPMTNIFFAAEGERRGAWMN